MCITERRNNRSIFRKEGITDIMDSVNVAYPFQKHQNKVFFKVWGMSRKIRQARGSHRHLPTLIFLNVRQSVTILLLTFKE